MTENEKYFGKRNIFVTGRATTGLWLILKSEGISHKKVMFPANICYAPVFGAIFAENKPVFVDIADWANVSLEGIKNSVTADVACIVLPHMYGKVCKDVEGIAVFCREKHILLIEDCASAFGATLNSKPVGSFGDYSLFSFDYSKIVDIGFGGIVVSNRNLNCFTELEAKLPFWNSDKDFSLSMFSKLYRVIRNSEDNTLIRRIYQILPSLLQDYFLFRITEDEKNLVLNSLIKVEAEKQRRWAAYHSLAGAIKSIPCLELCKYEEEDIPWRFNFLYRGNKKSFVQYLLERKIPISDWYPFIGKMFSEENTAKYKNVLEIEKYIYNLPLHNSDSMLKALSEIKIEEVENE